MRRDQLTRLAAEGMSVLTKQGGVLPLAAGGTITLIGRHALDTATMGGGPAYVEPPYEICVAVGPREALPGAVTVVDGVEVCTRPVPAPLGFLLDPVTGTPGVRFTVLAADGTVLDERLSALATTAVGWTTTSPAGPPR